MEARDKVENGRKMRLQSGHFMHDANEGIHRKDLMAELNLARSTLKPPITGLKLRNEKTRRSDLQPSS